MRETIMDKPVASVTLRELIETFREVVHEVIREEQEHYIDDEGYLVFSSERAYAEYMDKQKGKLPGEVQLISLMNTASRLFTATTSLRRRKPRN